MDDDIQKWLHSTYHGVPADRIIGTAALLIGGLLLMTWLISILRRILLKTRSRLHMSYEAVIIVTRVARIALLVGLAFLLLNLWGVGLSGLWTSLVGVATIVGVGFLAVWTMISNVTANLFLTIWRPFHLGAEVELLPEKLGGKVVDVNLMFTIMREEGGSEIYVPNNLFFQKAFRVTSGDVDDGLFENIHPHKLASQTKADKPVGGI